MTNNYAVKKRRGRSSSTNGSGGGGHNNTNKMKSVHATTASSATASAAAEESNLSQAGDLGNVALLLLLYFLQGIPMGLSATLDLSLQEGGKVSLEEQGIFNLVGWPYSLKMLWAPIVDSVFMAKFGRRKSWLVPCQFLIGLLMIVSAYPVEDFLGSKSVVPLTIIFFAFYVLAATQDIAVDGWALEILAKRNLGWASTCNSIGLTAGFYCSFTGFMALRAYDVCSLPTFMIVSGVAFLVTTAFLAVFKKEAPQPTQVMDMTVMDSYRSMLAVIRLPAVQTLVLILFTRALAFAATDTLSSRKLLAAGMKKESLASLMVVLTPIQMVLPGIIAKWTATRPLRLFVFAVPARLCLVICSMLLVANAPDFSTKEDMSIEFWIALISLTLIGSIVGTVQFVSLMAFFAKISDSSVGGTYMTLLNTATNLGNKWPNTLVLFFVNYCSLTWPMELDGYYVLGIISMFIGMAWMWMFTNTALSLEKLKENSWRVVGVGGGNGDRDGDA